MSESESFGNEEGIVIISFIGIRIILFEVLYQFRIQAVEEKRIRREFFGVEYEFSNVEVIEVGGFSANCEFIEVILLHSLDNLILESFRTLQAIRQLGFGEYIALVIE